MDELERQGGGSASAQVEGLRDELRVMRLLLSVALVMLIALSICADFYFSGMTANIRAQASQLESVVDAFPQGAANDFVSRLKEYAKTHPDFSPIATKYAGVFSQQTTPGASKK